MVTIKRPSPTIAGPSRGSGRLRFARQSQDVLLGNLGINGKFFKVHDVLLAKGKRPLGVLGVRERVEMVGGTFKIESKAGQGTWVSAEISVHYSFRPKRGK